MVSLLNCARRDEMTRSLFYIFMSTIVLGISSLGTALVLYVLDIKKKKRIFWTVQVIFALVLGITMYYQLQVAEIPLGWGKDFLRLFAIEGNGIIVGAIITIIIFLVLGILKFARYCIRKLSHKEKSEHTSTLTEEGLSRRGFLKTAGAVVPAVVMGSASSAAFDGASRVITTEYDLHFSDLPKYLHNYRIVQLTDVHIGPFIDLDDFDAMIEQAAAKNPNRLVITGDIIDDLSYLDGLVERLHKAVHHFPDGIDYILGNHEYIRNVDLILEKLKTTPIRIYRNTNRLLSGGDRPVYMVGVDYNFKKDREWNPRFLDAALEGVPQNAFIILLAHHPSFIHDAFERNIPITLTGHTHGGQINLWGVSLVPVAKPYWKGMYRDSRGNYGYVGNGAGHWFPVRWNCPREITVFTFQNK